MVANVVIKKQIYCQPMHNNQSTFINVFWFRRDLRLHDNHGLYQALAAGIPVLPVFIFDTEILNKLEDKADKRVDFIHQALNVLDTALKARESSLLVKYGNSLEIVESLTAEYAVSAVYTNRDYEPQAIQRDFAVKKMLHQKGIAFHDFKDQVVFEWNEVLKSDGKPYTVYTPYSKQWKARLTGNDLNEFDSENTGEFVKLQAEIPTLSEIGFQNTSLIFAVPKVDEQLIRKYDQVRDFPAIQGTSTMSVHLRFGTVSIRELVKFALKTNEVWLNELIWREFFMSILAHFPRVVNHAFKPKYDEIRWRNNEVEFEKWCIGQTGYPMVDAGMRELNQTGLMHNRLRMVVASFLTKHLLIDWRWGEAYFAKKLLDYDLAANNGNWQWAAGCGCDAAPYFRVFNPSEQARKFDPELKYIRRWVPELDTFDYPQPIVEHTLARQRALNTFKAALNENFAED